VVFAVKGQGRAGQVRMAVFPVGFMTSRHTADKTPLITMGSLNAPVVGRFGSIVLSQCAVARVLLDERRHNHEREGTPSLNTAIR
jgi:hypothetical protein